MFARLRSFVSASLRRRRFEQSMDDELRFHIETYADDLVRSGVPPVEAMRRARLEFGGVETVKDDCRQGRGLRALDEIRQDVRYATRTIGRTPIFTAAVVMSLALGIGASTAIFTLMDAVLFRTLWIDDPQRLYFLAHDPGPNVSTSSNYPLFERYRGASVFSGVTAYLGRTFRVSTPEGLERVPGQFVSGNYHAVVGAPIALGRGFSSEPDRLPGASPVAVISDHYWMTRFGRDPNVIGKSLNVGGRTVSIVGVTAPEFRGLSTSGRVDITLPISQMTLDTPAFLDDHGGWISMVILGRLAPGATEREALAAVDVLFQQFVDQPENRWVRAATRTSYQSAALVSAARGTWALRKQYARPLWVLMGMVSLILLIACANVANLLLARATTRRREMAVRLSIGAGRQRLVRQLLTESLLLSLCGGVAGVAIAIFGTRLILSFLEIGPSPVLLDADINVRVLAFTAAVVLLTGVGFGLVPAFRSTQVDLAPALKDGRTNDRRVRPALGKALVVAQVALSVVIVAAAGLLARSLANLHGIDAGFDRQNIVLADVDTGAAAIPPQNRLRLYLNVLDRLRAVPSVEAASLAARTPIDFSSQLRRIEVPGHRWTPGQGVSSNVVTPGYFRTFGIDLIRGRDFTSADRGGALPVAVVSRSIADFYFGETDPIGRTLQLGGEKQQRTIVGIVEDVRHEQLRVKVAPRMVYTPLEQPSTALDGVTDVPTQLTVAVRTGGNPAAMSATLRAEVRATSKDALVPYVRTMERQIAATLVPEHLLATLSTGFAAVALLLACVGLYGVMSYNVSRRTREIGIRIALGALPRTVLFRVLGETLRLSTVGVALGVLGALALARTLSTFLFGLTSHDPATLLGTTALLLAVALLSGFLPARHAATVDPVRALKNE